MRALRILLAPVGAALLATAAVDWAAYSGFVISLVWPSWPGEAQPFAPFFAPLSGELKDANPLISQVLILAAVVLFLGARGGARRWLRVVATALATAGIGWAAWLLHAERSRTVEAAVHPNPADKVFVDIHVWLASPLLSSIGLGLVAVTVASLFRTLGPLSPPQRVARLAGAWMAAVVGGGIAAFAASISMTELIERDLSFEPALAIVAWSHAAIWASAILWAGARARTTPTLASGLVLVVAGLGVFLATRPMAEDAAAPLALRYGYPHDTAPDLTAPRVCDSPALVGGPELKVHQGEVAVNGSAVETLGDAGVALDESIRQHVGLYPDGDAPEQVLMVLADGSTPMSALEPLFGVFSALGGTKVRLLVVHRRVYRTATAGEVEDFDECARTFELSRDGRRFATWDDVARAPGRFALYFER